MVMGPRRPRTQAFKRLVAAISSVDGLASVEPSSANTRYCRLVWQAEGGLVLVVHIFRHKLAEPRLVLASAYRLHVGLFAVTLKPAGRSHYAN